MAKTHNQDVPQGLHANDRRISTETGVEAKIASIIEPEANYLGFRLVRVKLSAANGTTLQVMAEREDGTMSVEDCETLSRAISPVLDVQDPVEKAYHLEVSSPGIDRPLVRRSDFETWTGHVAKLETGRMIDGRKRFKGVITGFENNEVRFRRETPSKDESAEFTIPLDTIATARLVLTDELITEALKRDKALRTANGLDEEELKQGDN